MFFASYFSLSLVHVNINLHSQPATTITRSFRMGFQNFPAKTYQAIALQALDLWTRRADAAIISIQVPWAQLYSGTTLLNNILPIILYRTG